MEDKKSVLDIPALHIEFPLCQSVGSVPYDVLGNQFIEIHKWIVKCSVNNSSLLCEPEATVHSCPVNSAHGHVRRIHRIWTCAVQLSLQSPEGLRS